MGAPHRHQQQQQQQQQQQVLDARLLRPSFLPTDGGLPLDCRASTAATAAAAICHPGCERIQS